MPATAPTARSPAGLVTLRELGGRGRSARSCSSAGLWLHPSLALLLALVWSYLGLMRKEFFVREQLTAHPLVYL